MELVCSLCLGGSEGHIVFMSNENQVGVSASTSPPLAGGRGASQKIMKCLAGGRIPILELSLSIPRTVEVKEVAMIQYAVDLS